MTTSAVVLLLLLSAIGISSAAPVVVKKPPFPGSVFYNHFLSRYPVGCNSHAATIVPGSFNNTSGITRISVKSTTQICLSGNGSAGVGGYLGVTDVGFKVPSSRKYNVSAYWSVRAGVNISVFYKGNATMTLGGFIALIPNLCILKASSGGVVICKAAGGYSWSSGTNLSTNITWSRADIIGGLSLIGGQSYDFRAFLNWGVAANAYTPASLGSRVSATLDMSSGGYGASLVSLTVN